jgi:hypothetical protein
MAKGKKAENDTIENRVYLFESLAGQFVAASAERLSSPQQEERLLAMRALADLAWVSCVVADSGVIDPDAVRARILEGAASSQAGTKKGTSRS